MKKILSYLLVIVLVLSININCKAFSRDYNVRDYSDTLNEDELEELRDMAEDFYDKHALELVIVIYDYGYDEYSLEDAGDRYFDYMYEDDFGVYLALDNSNAINDDYIAVVKGSNKNYTDSEIDNMYGDLSSVKYSGTYAIAKKFVSSAEKYVDEETYEQPKNYLPLACVPFVIATIAIIIMIAKNKMVRKATKAAAYLDKDNINFTNRQDRFVTTTTSRVRINTSSSSGGHRSGGFHGGSSGMSRGGGGRHL